MTYGAQTTELALGKQARMGYSQSQFVRGSWDLREIGRQKGAKRKKKSLQFLLRRKEYTIPIKKEEKGKEERGERKGS